MLGPSYVELNRIPRNTWRAAGSNVGLMAREWGATIVFGRCLLPPQFSMSNATLNRPIDAPRTYLHEVQNVLDKLDDATTELMSGEGDSVMLMLGDGFMECEEEYATNFCERKQEVRYMYIYIYIYTRPGAIFSARLELTKSPALFSKPT